MSRNYEMMYILRPDLAEEQVNQTIEKYRTFLSDQGAENITIQNRGKRRLAYPIKNFLDGVYIQMNYKADGQQVAPIERSMRLSEEVIRYLTLTLPDDPVVKEKAESDSEQEEATPEAA
jgi:small subunit ribosomal protein S6